MDNKLSQIKDDILRKIRASDGYKKSETWYKALPTRDALILKVLLILVLLALVFTWLIQPTINSIKQSEKAFSSELRFHSKLKDNAYLVNGSKANAGNQKGSILSRVNSLAKTKGIKLKRFEPNGNNGLRVWLEKVHFDTAIDWIETLEVEKGIKVEQISIDKVETGIVNLRAVLKL